MTRFLVALALVLVAQISPLHAQTQIAGKATDRSTVNGSIAITTGNTFQTILAAPTDLNIGRQSLTIQNNNATDSCWISFGTFGGVTITAGNATKARSILLLPGGSYTRYWPFVPSDEIEGTCTTSTTDTFYVDFQ